MPLTILMEISVDWLDPLVRAQVVNEEAETEPHPEQGAREDEPADGQ